VLKIQHHAVCEIILVDQSDNTVIQQNEKEKLQDWKEDGKIIWLKSGRKNLPAARNLILKKAKGDVILFLDDDVILPPGFIESHYNHHCKNNGLIAVAGLSYDRLHEVDVGIINLDNYKTYTQRRKDFENYSDHFNDFIGANHSISKTLASIEGYDENFIGYGEDTDMSKRIVKLKKGIIICDPKAWLIHLRAPAGGCRITDNKIKRNEVEIVGPFILYALRHLTGSEKRKAIINTVRVGPLRKENVHKLWRQSFVWFQYSYSFYWALKNKNKVKSPFVKN